MTRAVLPFSVTARVDSHALALTHQNHSSCCFDFSRPLGSPAPVEGDLWPILYSQPWIPWLASDPTLVTNIEAGSQPATSVTFSVVCVSRRPASGVPAGTLQRWRPIRTVVAVSFTVRAVLSVCVRPTTIRLTVGAPARDVLAVAPRGATEKSRPDTTVPSLD